MKIALYLDEDSQESDLVKALRFHQVDVLSSAVAGMNGRADPEQLEYATSVGRVIYTYNARDFYRLHTAYLVSGRSHAGIILAPQQQYSIGEQLRRLLKLLNTKSAEALRNQVEFLGRWG